jgi:S1-C subfamily serine protease
VAQSQAHAVGTVVAHVNGEWTAQGSCFLFRSDVVALAAAHCVPETLEPFVVSLPHVGRNLPVERIERHATADIAMLFCIGEDTRTESGYPTIAFWDGLRNWSMGEPFYAYGYPIEGPTEGLYAGTGSTLVHRQLSAVHAIRQSSGIPISRR